MANHLASLIYSHGPVDHLLVRTRLHDSKVMHNQHSSLQLRQISGSIKKLLLMYDAALEFKKSSDAYVIHFDTRYVNGEVSHM